MEATKNYTVFGLGERDFKYPNTLEFIEFGNFIQITVITKDNVKLIAKHPKSQISGWMEIVNLAKRDKE